MISDKKTMISDKKKTLWRQGASKVADTSDKKKTPWRQGASKVADTRNGQRQNPFQARNSQ
jgi:hypothetical protein